MMLRRRMPSATPRLTNVPSSSGPRWRITSHIEWMSARLSSGPNGSRVAGDSTNPAIPHIVANLRARKAGESPVEDEHAGDTTVVVHAAEQDARVGFEVADTPAAGSRRFREDRPVDDVFARHAKRGGV